MNLKILSITILFSVLLPFNPPSLAQVGGVIQRLR